VVHQNGIIFFFIKFFFRKKIFLHVPKKKKNIRKVFFLLFFHINLTSLSWTLVVSRSPYSKLEVNVYI
jgi:hypothetical protein